MEKENGKDPNEKEKKQQEEKSTPTLVLSNPPHFQANQSVPKIMWLVVCAMLPACIYSIHLYGIKAGLLLLTGLVAGICAEALFQLLMKKPITIRDGSAAITGLLVAMNVPPDAPGWMVAIGSVFAVIIVKQLFGGLGFNIFNPALAARAFMLASWPVEMTTRWHKFEGTNVFSNTIDKAGCLSKEALDVVTGATPLGVIKDAPAALTDMGVSLDCFYNFIFSNINIKSLFIGNIGGVIGETSALLLLLGGLFLLVKKIITWHIPVSYIGTVAACTLLYYTLNDFAFPETAVLYHVLSGGLFLGAFFMATDMVTSPITGKGMIIFGVGCGIITSVIRLWGGYPEGVSYSILLMNAAVPLIDKFTKPKLFGK